MKRWTLALAAVVVAAGILPGPTAADEHWPHHARYDLVQLHDHGHHGYHGWVRHGLHRFRNPDYYRHPYSRYGHDEYWYDHYNQGFVYPHPMQHHVPYYVPPLFLPSETLYGPEAMKRFMGFAPGPQPRAVVGVAVDPAADQPVPARAAAEGPPQQNLRGTNQRSIELAWKFIGYGDAYFGNQKYTDANSRYRKASRTAPQLADGWFRQGFSLAAIGRHDLALKAIKRGLAFEPQWADSDFRLVELYGGNKLAKAAHVDALAEAAEKDPHNADLLFLLGVYLHFDGQPDRATTFFNRSRQLLGGNDSHLTGFLP